MINIRDVASNQFGSTQNLTLILAVNMAMQDLIPVDSTTDGSGRYLYLVELFAIFRDTSPPRAL